MYGARFWFPGILLGLLAIYRLSFPPPAGGDSHLSELPMEMLGLPGEDVPVEQAILDDLASDDLLIRRYQRPDGLPVWVVLIYFVNSRRGGHDPQLCYRSQGYQIGDESRIRIESRMGEIESDTFLATRSSRSERVATLWYMPGGIPTPDVGRYRGQLFLQGLRRNRSSGVFVRISTFESTRGGEAEAWNKRFVAEIVARLPGLVR